MNFKPKSLLKPDVLTLLGILVNKPLKRIFLFFYDFSGNFFTQRFNVYGL